MGDKSIAATLKSLRNTPLYERRNECIASLQVNRMPEASSLPTQVAGDVMSSKFADRWRPAARGRSPSSSRDCKRDSTSLRREFSGGHTESRKSARASGSNSSAVYKTSLTLCQSSGVIHCFSNGNCEGSPSIAILRTPLWLLSGSECRNRRPSIA